MCCTKIIYLPWWIVLLRRLGFVIYNNHDDLLFPDDSKFPWSVGNPYFKLLKCLKAYQSFLYGTCFVVIFFFFANNLLTIVWEPFCNVWKCSEVFVCYFVFFCFYWHKENFKHTYLQERRPLKHVSLNNMMNVLEKKLLCNWNRWLSQSFPSICKTSE